MDGVINLMIIGPEKRQKHSFRSLMPGKNEIKQNDSSVHYSIVANDSLDLILRYLTSSLSEENFLMLLKV